MDPVTQLLAIVLFVLAVIGILAIRRKTLAKMALRNIVRKRKFTAIITAGLLIATAMISGSLVMADTLDYIIKKGTFDSTGAVDIVVSAKDYTSKDVYFDASIASNLRTAISNGSTTYVDGAAPAIRESISVMNQATGLPYPSAILFGFDLNSTLNPLLDENKNPVTLDDISGQKMVINNALADELNAKVGDTLEIIGPMDVPDFAQVSHIAFDNAMGKWQNNKIVFVDLEFAQNVVMDRPNMINKLDVSNTGSISSGYMVTDQAVRELKGLLPTGLDYVYDTVKKDGVDAAKATSDSISQLFIIMSSFTIIAGVALIVNLFVMLAEERKPEMGISRAIGMQRGDLTQAFLFEGVVYALFAAVIGAFVGLLIAGIMMGLFSSLMGGSGMAFTLHFKPISLLVAGCAGFLITLLTIVLASWRVSNLNIVRAIRDIPEPVLAKSGRKYLAAGILGIVIGFLMLGASMVSKQAAGLDAGPALLVLGASMVLIRYVHPRWPFTVSGAFIIWWVLDPTNVHDALFGTIKSGMEMFIISGILLVIAGVVIAIFNSDILLAGLSSVARRRRSLLPVFKTAISYPMNKKFRTGLSLFIFALIMFTMTMMAMIASFERESVDATTQQFSGGFELMGMSIKDVPTSALNAGMQDLRDAGVIDRVEASVTAPISIIKNGTNETVPYYMLGMTQSMLENNKFSLNVRSSEYASDEEVWRAVAQNSSLVVIDGSVRGSSYGLSAGTLRLDLGEIISMVMSDGHQVHAKVIGIMDQTMNMAVFTSNDFILNSTFVVQRNLFYISTSHQSNWTDTKVAQELEKRFVTYGMRIYVARDTIETLMGIVSSTMQLMEIFLGMGLIVGISGLGIITIRSVAERRQEIGVMRSIGFQRDMILKTFMLETSFVSLLGIALGVVLGLALSYRLWEWGGFRKYSPFVVPWLELLMLVAIAFLITLAATLPPARSASKLAPAEALRRVD
jgi:putative ABC transport system permease protein